MVTNKQALYLVLRRSLWLLARPVLLHERLGLEQLRLGVEPVERVRHPEEVAEAPVEAGLVPQRGVHPHPLHAGRQWKCGVTIQYQK